MMVKLSRINLAVAVLGMAGCVAPSPRVVPVVPVTPVVPVVKPVSIDHKLTEYGYWLDSGKASNTNLVTIQWWNTEEEKNHARDLFEMAKNSGRKVILWTPFFSYGPTERSTGGYYLDQSSINKWEAAIPFISGYSDFIFSFYLADEIPDVAWGDKGSLPYDPNLYNYIVEYGSNVIKATFPNAKVALNYGNVPADLIVPNGLDWVGLESYYGDYKAKLTLLESKTKLPLMLMPQAFDDGNYGDAGDKTIAGFAKDLYTYARSDLAVFGLYPFLYCIEASPDCDDIKFSTVGGANLPLTKQALEDIGKDIIEGQK